MTAPNGSPDTRYTNAPRYNGRQTFRPVLIDPSAPRLDPSAYRPARWKRIAGFICAALACTAVGAAIGLVLLFNLR